MTILNFLARHLFLFLIFFTSLSLCAQEKEINGTVTDSNGIPLLGVNIEIKNSAKGTTTDFDGNFVIQANPDDILKFSSIGMKTVEITVGSSTVLTVVLEEDSQALDEVVVTAFGRTMTRNESTSNVVSISSEDLLKQNFTDATQSLQGKVSGLVVNAVSGTPGSAPEIRIRGMNSITANNEPLFVIDGMPVNSGNLNTGQNSSLDVFSLINPSDIENISVLKDASAVAPYGADGANGVVLITTKSGKSGNARYSLNLSSGFRNEAIKGPRMATGEEKLEGMLEGIWNSYGSEFAEAPLSERISSRNELYDKAYSLLPKLREWDRQGRPVTDWKELATNKNAFFGDIDFSVSQGNEKSNFYGSLGFNKTDGTIIDVYYKRWTGSVKYNTQLNDKLNLSLMMNVANAEQDGILELGTLAPFDNPNAGKYFASPWARIYNDDGSFNIGSDLTLLTSQANIAYTQKHNKRNNNVTRAIPTGVLEYRINDNLSLRTLLGMDYTLVYRKIHLDRHHGPGERVNGSNSTTIERLFQYTTQNSLDYKIKVADNHNFHFTLLQEFSKQKDDFATSSGENLAHDQLHNLSGATANFSANTTFSDVMKMRYVGLVNYNFATKYLVDVSYSYQGDSRFSNKYDGFYSIGLGWNLHKEDFFEQVDFINVLRLKMGYGITGNAGIDRNRYQALIRYDRYNDNPAAFISGYGTDAKWEKSTRYDIALDYGFFNGRLRGSIGTFINQTSDMLFDMPIPLNASFLQAQILMNAGKMTNKGIEFDINADLISTDDFLWSLSANIATLNNKINDLPEDAEFTTSRQAVHKGRKVYEWYLPDWAGIDQKNGLPQWYDENGNRTGNYDEARRVYSGHNPIPKYTGSISTRLDYRNLFVEAMVYFSGGHQIYDNRPEIIASTSAASFDSDNLTHDAFVGAWRSEDIPATYPRFDYLSREVSDGSNTSNKFLHDATFARLRDIGIGYSFDNSGFIRDLGISRLSISLRGSNLYTWVKDKMQRWDPEVKTDIIERSNFRTPPVKSVSFNINVNF